MYESCLIWCVSHVSHDASYVWRHDASYDMIHHMPACLIWCMSHVSYDVWVMSHMMHHMYDDMMHHMTWCIICRHTTLPVRCFNFGSSPVTPWQASESKWFNKWCSRSHDSYRWGEQDKQSTASTQALPPYAEKGPYPPRSWSCLRQNWEPWQILLQTILLARHWLW